MAFALSMVTAIILQAKQTLYSNILELNPMPSTPP
jgi:hypothetical protein